MPDNSSASLFFIIRFGSVIGPTALQLGEVQTHLNLQLFPILADSAREPYYRLLDDVLEGGCARVTEVFESGSVPELKFVNECDAPVLLLDGEELIGARQDQDQHLIQTTVPGIRPIRTTAVGMYSKMNDLSSEYVWKPYDTLGPGWSVWTELE